MSAPSETPSTASRRIPETRRSTARILLALVLLLPFAGLGAWPLIDPDEARTAEVAREMLAGGDWAVPHINGLPRLDKPLLPYASTAASFALLGTNPFAARVPAALASALACLVVGLAFRRDFGRNGAAVAAMMMAGSPLLIFSSRGATIDALLLLWMTLAFASFWRGFLADRGTWWFTLAWLAMAAGILTKGPVALLPLAVALVHAILHRRRARSLFPPAGVAGAVVIVAPWVIAVERRFPDFLEYVFAIETVARTTTTELGRSGPFILPLATILIGTLPWVVIVVRALSDQASASRLRASELAHYFGLWIALPLLLFTLISSRRPQYVLPLVPAVVMLARLCWPDVLRAPRAVAIAAFLVGGLLGVAVPVALVSGADVPPVPLLILGFGGGLAWVVCGNFLRRGRIAPGAVALALFPLAIIPMLAATAPQLGGAETARALRTLGLDDAPLYGLHTYSPSLALGLGRTYGVVSHHGRELGGNYINHHFETLVDAPGSPLRSREWYDRNRETCEEPMIVIARADDRSTMTHLAEASIPIILRNERFVVADPCGLVPRYHASPR